MKYQHRRRQYFSVFISCLSAAALSTSNLRPNDPVPISTTCPRTIFAEGLSSSSTEPFSVASTRNAAAVSKDIFNRGDVLVSIPARLQGR